MVRVYIVTEVRSYRDALEQTLTRTGRVEIVGAAAHPSDAVGELGGLEAEVALLDIPGSEGPGWARELGAAAPEVRIIVLGLREAEQEIIAWAEAGVSGYVGRDACLDELLLAIEGTTRGEAACPARIAAVLLRRISCGAGSTIPNWQRVRNLTIREREILSLIGQGMSNQQIGRRLFIALPTVKNHVHNILEKLGVHKRAEAVQEIRRAGFVIRGRPTADRQTQHLLQVIGGSDSSSSDGSRMDPPIHSITG